MALRLSLSASLFFSSCSHPSPDLTDYFSFHAPVPLNNYTATLLRIVPCLSEPACLPFSPSTLPSLPFHAYPSTLPPFPLSPSIPTLLPFYPSLSPVAFFPTQTYTFPPLSFLPFPNNHLPGHLPLRHTHQPNIHLTLCNSVLILTIKKSDD